MNNKIIIAIIVGLVSISLTIGISYLIFASDSNNSDPKDLALLSNELDNLEERAFKYPSCDTPGGDEPAEIEDIRRQLDRIQYDYNWLELQTENYVEFHKLGDQSSRILNHIRSTECPIPDYDQESTEPVTQPVQIQPEPAPTSNLPADWAELTDLEKTNLNPFNCSATEWVSSENGSCIDKPISTSPNSLPADWAELTDLEKTDLNPLNCNLIIYNVSAKDGSCIDKPPRTETTECGEKISDDVILICN